MVAAGVAARRADMRGGCARAGEGRCKPLDNLGAPSLSGRQRGAGLHRRERGGKPGLHRCEEGWPQLPGAQGACCARDPVCPGPLANA